jgi:hypothetical protein
VTHDELVTVERRSIREFVASVDFHGDVLDYGCGQAPYRDLVERTARWHGLDRTYFPACTIDRDVGVWSIDRPNMILCTQVIQYTLDPQDFLANLRSATDTLVLTYPTCWPEVETEDLWRFTRAGMERLCSRAGWDPVRHELRATVGGFPLGYGLVAKAGNAS